MQVNNFPTETNMAKISVICIFNFIGVTNLTRMEYKKKKEEPYRAIVN